MQSWNFSHVICLTGNFLTSFLWSRPSFPTGHRFRQDSVKAIPVSRVFKLSNIRHRINVLQIRSLVADLFLNTSSVYVQLFTCDLQMSDSDPLKNSWEIPCWKDQLFQQKKNNNPIFLLQIYLDGTMAETYKHWHTLLVQLQCFFMSSSKMLKFCLLAT